MKDEDRIKLSRAIEFLTEKECESVTINANNADFSGPNSCISYNGRATEYEDMMFFNDTVLQCLEDAVFFKVREDGKNSL